MAIQGTVIGQTDTYHPFPDSDAVWVGHHWPGLINCGENYAYTLDGDTVIGAYAYHKVNIPYVNAYGACTVDHVAGYSGCIRQDVDARKVFWMPPDAVDEELLYDFSRQLGDVFPGFTRLGCTQPPSEITLIDSVLIGSTYRKQWHCGSFPSTNVLIEGIGFISGVLEGCATGMPDGPFNVLDCFSQDGVTLFTNGAGNCDMQTGTHLAISSFRTITYPDPFSLWTTMSFGRRLVNATLLVFDSEGQLVRQVDHVSGEDIVVQRGGLPPGYYSAVLIGGAGARLGAAQMVIENP